MSETETDRTVEFIEAIIGRKLTREEKIFIPAILSGDDGDEDILDYIERLAMAAVPEGR